MFESLIPSAEASGGVAGAFGAGTMWSGPPEKGFWKLWALACVLDASEKISLIGICLEVIYWRCGAGAWMTSRRRSWTQLRLVCRSSWHAQARMLHVLSEWLGVLILVLDSHRWSLDGGSSPWIQDFIDIAIALPLILILRTPSPQCDSLVKHVFGWTQIGFKNDLVLLSLTRLLRIFNRWKLFMRIELLSLLLQLQRRRVLLYLLPRYLPINWIWLFNWMLYRNFRVLFSTLWVLRRARGRFAILILKTVILWLARDLSEIFVQVLVGTSRSSDCWWDTIGMWWALRWIDRPSLIQSLGVITDSNLLGRVAVRGTCSVLHVLYLNIGTIFNQRLWRAVH